MAPDDYVGFAILIFLWKRVIFIYCIEAANWPARGGLHSPSNMMRDRSSADDMIRRRVAWNNDPPWTYPAIEWCLF
jgi:hypothetical protein